jgi:hypothetical protein
MHPIPVHKEVKRLLKRDGQYFMSTPNHTWLQNLIEGHHNLVYNPTLSHTVEHIRTYTYDSHKMCLAEAGLVIEEHVGADMHFCGVLNPMVRGACEMIKQKYGVAVSHWDMHLAMGKSHPHIQHTIALRCVKV